LITILIAQTTDVVSTKIHILRIF